MFKRVELKSSYHISTDTILQYSLIDSKFTKDFEIIERGQDIDSITIDLHNQLLWKVYEIYRQSSEAVCKNMPIMIKELFYHIPADVMKTDFYFHHPRLIINGINLKIKNRK